MEEQKVPMYEVKVGMQLSRPIYDSNGLLLLPKHYVLTPKMIIRLKMHGLEEIYIDSMSILQVATGEHADASYRSRVRETPAFKLFNGAHQQSVNMLKDAFNGILKDNDQIDATALLSEVNTLLWVNKNSIQVFDMLHCMRDYDDSTYVHSVNVALICHVIGEWLGFSEKNIETLTLCGLLHDVGKLMMPKEIIQKPDKLTPVEFATIKTHPYIGYSIVEKDDIDEHIKNSILQHHEKCDGSGYPNSLKGSEIDEFAKIVTIADIYDAMTANRVYREGLCPFDVIELFEQEGFQKYETRYLLTFLQRIVMSYINHPVKLSNNEEAKIIMVNPHALSKPVVQMGNEYIDLSKMNNLSIRNLI